MSPTVLVASLVAALLGPAHALGQEPNPRVVDEARALFAQGLAAAQERDWHRAVERFQRSYDALPLESTLLNLATAQEEAGLWVASLENRRRLLASESTAMRRHRAELARTIRALEARIPRIRLLIDGLRPSDEVRIDARVLDHDALSGEVLVDPRPQRIEVRRREQSIAVRSVTLSAGARETVPLDARLDPIALAHDDGATASSDDTLLWASIGVGAAAAVAAAVVIVVLAAASSDGRYVGNFGPGVVTFE